MEKGKNAKRKQLIACLAILLCGGIFAGCGLLDPEDFLIGVTDAPEVTLAGDVVEETRKPEETHVHDFREFDRVEADCLEPGTVYYRCGCGETFTEELPVLEHDYRLSDVLPANCTQSGWETYVCVHCSLAERKELSPLGHDFALTETVEPTYDTKGFDLFTCTRCGTEKQENFRDCLVHTEASWTDLCAPVSYVFAGMPHEPYREEITALLSGVYQFEDRKNVPSSEGKNIFPQLQTGHNHVTRNSIYGYSASSVSMFLCGKTDVQNMESDVLWAQNTVQALKIDGNTTQRDAIGRINEWICSHMRYDYSSAKQQELHPAIVSGRGICQVYGNMFQLLCQTCGIECYYICDEPRDHVYNSVIFSDGTVLYVDVTWNDTSSHQVELEEAGFSPEQIAYYRNRYLLKPYEEFMALHNWS